MDTKKQPFTFTCVKTMAYELDNIDYSSNVFDKIIDMERIVRETKKNKGDQQRKVLLF